MKFGIASYQDGKFTGMVARQDFPTMPDARVIAERWAAQYPRYSFRAVELDDKGYIVRTDTFQKADTAFAEQEREAIARMGGKADW